MTFREVAVPVKPEGNYGVDAPFVPWLWVGLSVFYACLPTSCQRCGLHRCGWASRRALTCGAPLTGGQLVIVDIQRTLEYARVLEALGAEDRELRGLGWRMWWSGPWMATTMVSARKRAR